MNDHADLLFPVILSADGRVMDGSHRIVAASAKGIEAVDVVQFNKDPMPGYTENLGWKSRSRSAAQPELALPTFGVRRYARRLTSRSIAAPVSIRAVSRS